MVAIYKDVGSSLSDPLLPWLKSIKLAFDAVSSSRDNNDGGGGEEEEEERDLEKMVEKCIDTFKKEQRYRDDVRFLKIWFIHGNDNVCGTVKGENIMLLLHFIKMDASLDFEKIYREMEQNNICLSNSELYVWYALFLEVKGKLTDAHKVYQLGISRKAEPMDRLNRAKALFCERMSEILNAFSLDKADGVPVDHVDNYANPWSTLVLNDLLQKMQSQISKYNGYHISSKPYSGKVPLSNLAKSARNKVVEIGGKKYLIKGCAGQGGFAQVFKAYVNSNPDDVVAMKIQKPAFPWEFYIYRQLDKRISEKNRSSFGFAHRLHLYSDYSVLVCDYLSNGTLQDAINSNVVTGGVMEEVLCIYYTIEMLSMLETLHSAGIIHGDFKPDNLLIRYARDDLKEEGFGDLSGSWLDQGLCLVDWGRGIDFSLFSDGTKFKGDCRTSGFRCVEMQEDKPWTFQVDTYGLCVIVHMMLHNSYMEIGKKTSPDGGYLYKPKSALKRYWQVDLWTELFTKLLNFNHNENHKDLLKHLKETFQDYICSNPPLVKKLKQLLLKQRTSLCSA